MGSPRSKGWHEIRFLKTGMLSRKSDVDRAQQTKNAVDAISKLVCPSPPLRCASRPFFEGEGTCHEDGRKFHSGPIKWIVGIPADILETFYTLASILEHAEMEEYYIRHEAEAIMCATASGRPVEEALSIYIVTDLASVTTVSRW